MCHLLLLLFTVLLLLLLPQYGAMALSCKLKKPLKDVKQGKPRSTCAS